MSMPIGAANQAQKKWTIMYYFDGKNNLAPMAEHSFNSLDQVGSDDNVNLVAQFGMPKKAVLQGLIEKNAGAANLADVGEKDMGSAENLKQFVEWGMKNYPAEHYALVMWDHGAGFKGSMVDDETEHIIKNHDLAAALEDVAKTTGKKMDIINWNACLMQQAEVGYELRNAASYMVGSQEVEAGLRIPIPGLFGTTPQHEVAKDLQEACKSTKGGLSPEEVAKLFVFEAKQQFGGSMFTPTQSAIDLSKMDKVKSSMDNLASALLEAIDADPSNLDRVRSDIKGSQRMIAADMYLEPYVDYRDLGDFARTLVKDGKLNASNPKVGEAAKDVMRAVQEAVIAEQHAPISGFGGRSLEGATGMTAYIPRDYGHDKVGKSTIDGLPNGGTHGYENQGIAKDTKWETLLKKVSKDDDLMGKMPGQRALMNFGQVANFYGYQIAWQAAGGALKASWNVWPLAGFPYFLPIPGAIAAGAGAIGNLLRVKKGINKMTEGMRREDSPMKNRVELGVQGALDTAVGLGSVAVCGAMAVGVSAPWLAPLAIGVMAVGAGRLAVSLGRNLWKKHQTSGMSVEQKLAAAPAGPSFSALKDAGQPAPGAPAAKANPQPAVVPAPAQQAAQKA